MDKGKGFYSLQGLLEDAGRSSILYLFSRGKIFKSYLIVSRTARFKCQSFFKLGRLFYSPPYSPYELWGVRVIRWPLVLCMYRPKKLGTSRAGPTRLLPGLAGADSIFQWIGLMEYILCYSALVVHWHLLPVTRESARQIYDSILLQMA
jgi:hypothetical protein